MSIETIGGMNRILNNYDAQEWTKSADLESLPELDANVFSGNSLKSHESKRSFSEMLTDSIGEVNGLQTQADTAIQKLVTGESKNLHETMLAVEKADIAFKTMNQIRHKVIDAYKEVMRMQV
jgi:flagellar hook-basal body complex protein FliE